MNRILKSLALVIVMFATVFTSCEDEFGGYGSGSGNGSSGTEVTPPEDPNPPVTDPYDVTNFRCLKTFTGHSGNVTSVAYSPDGTKIISGSGDNKIKIWNSGIKVD